MPNLENVKAGDWVWFGDWVWYGSRTGYTQRRISQLKVDRTTDKQIVCGSDRYYRSDGLIYGNRSSAYRLLGVASSAEVEEWQKEQYQAKIYRDRRAQLAAVREDKRLDLLILCGDDCSVESSTDDPQTWQLTIHRLPEDAIRYLATVVKAIKEDICQRNKNVEQTESPNV
jgi:hypothetical protein